MINEVYELCLSEKSKNPIYIFKKLINIPSCPMHSPVHHFLVGACLLTAYKNAGGSIDLKDSLDKLYERSSKVPAGACGLWGACGAGVSSGMYISIVTGAGPLNKPTEWGLANQMTAKSLLEIGKMGGPRCCKRDSYLSIIEAVKFTKEHLKIDMELENVKCIHAKLNPTCLKEICPFYI